MTWGSRFVPVCLTLSLWTEAITLTLTKVIWALSPKAAIHIYNCLGKFVFCFLENNQDMQLLHSFEMFTCGCPNQPIANTNLMRSLRTSIFSLSLRMYYNWAENTRISSCLELLPLFLCYSEFLHQLLSCSVVDRLGKKGTWDLRKDTISYSPATSLWEPGPLEQSLLSMSRSPKGSPKILVNCMVLLYDATWVQAFCQHCRLFSSALLSTAWMSPFYLK